MMTADDRHRMERLVEEFAEAKAECGQQHARAERAEAEVQRLAKVIVEIRAALSEVAVYEGILDVSPTAMMVAQLAQDHEELEARLDAIGMVCRRFNDLPKDATAARIARRAIDDIAEIGRLVQGGTRIPDSPEGLE